ncbi:hypothetical protein NW762_000063 [Fusarium torreyae]|uniref:Uncharacterized protein n=1 Tax=Fusarium torreyae TaxID=1237075 RepID=A0A9W8SH63_9HYPO|nr:hypothetical protein NW762_000063 [Fusarium torreyae]
MQEDDPLRMFFDTCAQGIRKYGCTNFGKQDIRNSLRSAGFIRVQMVSKKVPISSWPRDEAMKDIGTLMEANILEYIGALAAKPLVALGIPEGERKDMVSRACKSLKYGKAHRYMNCRFVFGQKDDEGSAVDSGSDL